MKMNAPTTLEEDSERLTLQRLILDYLDPYGRTTWMVGDAQIESFRVHNRCGVPAEGQTTRYDIVYPAEGWGVRARAVWCDGGLLKPLRTHVRVEGYYDLSGLDDEQATRDRFRIWLRGLDL